ncbi:MAG: FecR family protein [Steroidobacteraceae bacterium]
MSLRKAEGTLNAQIYDEACAWFVEMRAGDVDGDNRRQFNSWLRKSPEHVRAYLEISEIWDDAPLVRSERTGSREVLIDRAKESGDVLPLGPPRSSQKPGRTRAISGGARGWRYGPRPLAAAAIIALAVTGGLVAYQVYRAPTYATGIGEQRIVTLSDGSRVELNSRTLLRVRYSARERDVNLIEGQALFRVAKNPQRPFIVRSGEIMIRAVGTQFDVDRTQGGTTVTVVEGRVVVRRLEANDLAPPPLAQSVQPLLKAVVLDAGEEVTASGVAPLLPAHANINAATAWTRGTLVFEGTRLSEVVEDFNRQNQRQLIIGDPSLGAMRISGVYSSTDAALLIHFLREQPGIKVDDSGSTIVISAK